MMDALHYNEMKSALEQMIIKGQLEDKKIYAFGYCNATEKLADLLTEKGYVLSAILDNNILKQGIVYHGIYVVPPEMILSERKDVIVCIAARAYEAMASQLRRLGFKGKIQKIVEYNSYSEYSLADNTIKSKYERVMRGISKLNVFKKNHPYYSRILCPFSALGDVFYMMSYLPYFLKKNNVEKYVVFVMGNACADVVRMFGAENVEILPQNDMDEIIQAELYTQDTKAFIPHQDRPYVVNLYKALYVKMIPLEVMYRCGVYGLPIDTVPYKPTKLSKYSKLNGLKRGKSLIISPYAKSVTNIPTSYWYNIISEYKQKDYEIFTSAVGDEETLPGTKRIEVPLAEMQSVVEYAGEFIGLRSGLCDVIKYADCKKTAVYPDRCYSDTQWKMEQIYHLDDWNNVVIEQEC